MQTHPLIAGLEIVNGGPIVVRSIAHQIGLVNTRAYSIDVLPVQGVVVARRNGAVLATSGAAKVMHETRLAPTIYFPRDNVQARLSGPTVHRTFCPFKGTASYWDLVLDEGTLPNAGWSYDNALSEAKAVEGYVGLMRGVADDMAFEGTKPAQRDDGNISGPLVDWLMQGAWQCSSPEALTEALALNLIKNGIALARISVMIWSLHPSIVGRNYLWEKQSGEVISRHASFDMLENPAYVNSPLRHVASGLGGVRQNLTTENAEFSFPIMGDLKARGLTDYVAMPLPFSQGRTNVLSLTCDDPKGFTTADLGLVFECATAISRFYEVFALRENASALLETYLGKRTGARVLEGKIRRGDGDNIDAAILFCDLRNSSRLEEELGRTAYLDLLNRFFESTAEVINANQGEILKFIGDAVLAIFPAAGDHLAACTHAVMASAQIADAMQTLKIPGVPETLDCAIGLSFGNVTYGNIGSVERLDFTVTGKAANVASRLSDLGKQNGHRILATAELAEARPIKFQSIGKLHIKGLGEELEAFAFV